MAKLASKSARDACQHAEVEALASRVLKVLAARAPNEDGALADEFMDRALDRLVSAVRQRDDSERDRAVAELIAGGVTINMLVDKHIPEAARRMGESWCNDGMSFADVTIGVARLQSLLRDLARRDLRAAPNDPMAPQVLMVVRQDDYHTLGAMVATQQLRRLGIGVHVTVGQPDEDVLALLASSDFDMVMISSSASERLETLRKFVDKIRKRVGSTLPVVVGGTALNQGRDVKAITGADFATGDPEAALRRCGLKLPSQGAARHATLD